MNELVAGTFASDNGKGTRTIETMAIIKDDTTATNLLEQYWLMIDSLRGSAIHMDIDLRQLFAFLFYLRQNDCLIVKNEKEILDGEYVICTDKGESVCCDANVFSMSCDAEFLQLLRRTIALIMHVDDQRKHGLTKVAKRLNEIELGLDEWLLFFDMTIAAGGVDKYYSEFSQPHELTEVMSYLLNGKVRKIFDPFGGFMDFATTINASFTANEIKATIRDIAMFRLAMAGAIDRCKINLADSTNWTSEVFDAIVTAPPFGFKMQMKDEGATVNENSELVALKRFEKTTEAFGQLVTVVPVSVLYNESATTRLLREKLTRKNLLDCIIQLPGGLFPHTGLATAIVVLKKQRDKGQRIRFIDASTCVIKERRQNVLDVDAVKRFYEEKCFEVTTEEILEQHSTWDVQWYLNRMTAVFSQGYTVVKLSDVIEPVRASRHFTETMGRFVSIGSMPTDCFSFEKTPEDFPEKEGIQNVAKITEPVILVSMVGAPKPTYCKASEGSPIFVKSDICAFRITNNTIHEGYLCMELSKRLIPTMGALFPRLSRTQILETIIEFPSLNGERSFIEQKNIFEEARQTAEIGKVKEEWLEALLEKKKQEYIGEVRNRKHDMKTPMGQIRNTIKLLDSLTNHLTGEQAEKLGLYSQRLRKAMDVLSEIVSHIADEDVFAKPEPIDLGEVLSSQQTETDKYVISYYPDKAVFEEAGLSKPMVLMGKSDLLRLIQNIIGNAIERGFVDDYPEYSLNISLTIKDGFYIIDFSNNGRPLPEGMTKERYGMKGVKGKGSDGEGKGGYIVKSITEHYGGDYDVYSQQFAGMWFTHVIVKLPIYQDNE